MRISVLCGLFLLAASAPAANKSKPAPASALDEYIAQAGGGSALPQALPGSLWAAGVPLADLGRDLKAGQVNDLVTVVVAERASAVARGSTKTARASDAKYSAGGLFGVTRAAGPLANMLDVSGEQSLAGEGATSRENVLTTTLSARVTHVLPNGYLVVEGSKNVTINSEIQVVTVRGVVRPFDLSPGNLVRSERLGQLEVRLNGKGVIGDAIRRPNFLYRLLLGLLPF
jgi:flagellar L-ring protein precursor FlgH